MLPVLKPVTKFTKGGWSDRFHESTPHLNPLSWNIGNVSCLPLNEMSHPVFMAVTDAATGRAAAPT